MLLTSLEWLFWFSAAVPVYTYCVYPMSICICRLLVRKPASKADDKFQPRVSIILAAHNEDRHIVRKLENCLSLDYPANRIEIFVGSDGSDDGTNEILRSFESRGITSFVFLKRQGKMATVNRLVREASGEICVFSDISELFDRDAVRLLVRHFADREIGAVTGNHLYHCKSTGLGKGTAFYWKFQRFLQETESRIYSVFACDGTIYACRRHLFPYPPDDTINDDVAVPLGIIRQGKRVIFESQAIARGDVLLTTNRFLRQKVRSQAGKYQNFRQFPGMFIPWPLERFWIFFSHSVLPVLVPWFLVGALIANVYLGIWGPTEYRYLMALQIAFYGFAFLGWLSQRLGIVIPLSSIPFYFVIANLGSIFGFFAYNVGIRQAGWKKVD